ncbi:MAG: tail fiber domain-containing protein [Saprospiraceae bacterium]|nr:tail fiber domain-containing protein [Saprospiraceae bacterium]
MKRFFLFFLVIFLVNRIHGQEGVAINKANANPDASALLDISSTEKGILIPRMTQTQRSAILAPATGLLIYQTNGTTPGFFYYDGTIWKSLSADGDWTVDGSGNMTNANSGDVTISVDATINGLTVGRGSGNVAGNAVFGTSAFNSNTTGNNNTATGTYVLNSNLNGSANVASGHSSMYYASIGNDYNLALGVNSMRGTGAYTNTDFNIALGHQSLYSINGGDSNIGIGRNTLFSNTTGSYNQASGHYAMYYASAGNSYNIAAGIFAMRGNGAYTNSLYNVAIGYSSLRSINGGDFNVGLGHSSLIAITSGSSNVSIGSYSGENITTGSYNIMLGYNIDAPSAITSNQLNIGNLIFGTNLDGRNSTISSGNIGIGTKTPSAKLDVVGVLELSSTIPVDPGSDIVRLGDGGTNLHVQTNYGYTRLGPQNSTWSHFITDRSRYYFDKGITVDQGFIGSYNENMFLQTSGTTRMTISNSTGDVGIGTTNPLADLHINQSGGSASLQQTGGLDLQNGIFNWRIYNSNNFIRFNYSSNNGVTYTPKAYILPTDGSWNTLSDASLKKDIKPIGALLSKVKQLRPLMYHYNDNKKDDPLSIGFLAQEVQALFPNVVSRENDETLLGMDYTKFAVISIKAIQEQQEIIESQKAEIDGLKAQMKQIQETLKLITNKN